MEQADSVNNKGQKNLSSYSYYVDFTEHTTSYLFQELIAHYFLWFYK